MAHDFITRRIVHPVYLIDVVAVIYMKFWRRLFHETDSWSVFSDWQVKMHS